MEASPAVKSKEEKTTAGGCLRLLTESHPLSVAYEVSCRVRAERAAPFSCENCTPKVVVPPFPRRELGRGYGHKIIQGRRLV